MSITTISVEQLSKNPAKATQAANDGPVFITDNGRPTHVLMSMQQYCVLGGTSPKIADFLAMPETVDEHFHTHRSRELAGYADFENEGVAERKF